MRANPNQTSSNRSRVKSATAATAGALAVLGAGVAAAQTGGGGVAPPAEPDAQAMRCITNCINPGRGTKRSFVRVIGTELHQVHAISFNRRGGGRTRGLRLRVLSSSVVQARAPRDAVRGQVRVHSAGGRVADSPQILTFGGWAELRAKMAGWRFPVRGRHSFGGAAARFGAPRGGRRHQGHDVFARCGTRMVAARGGRVKFRGFQSSAGHYIVVRGARTRLDFVYMHLQRPSPVRRGQRIRTGQPVGRVGQTGNAVGCHLHFEIWRGNWHQGGQPINPLPRLRAWRRFSS